MIPKATTVMLAALCTVVTLLSRIFRKHKVGIITASSILRRDPIKAITRPKKGRRNATQTVEATSAVLSRIKHQKLLEILSGSNSSTALASGFIIRAYFVKGLITVVHTAIFEAIESRLSFRLQPMASKSHKNSTTATGAAAAAASTMDVEKIFHMNGGVGQTSYSKNSSLQKKGSDKVKHVTLEAIEQVYVSTNPRSLGIADLGCSSGPNTLSNIKEIVETVGRTSRALLLPEPEFRVYLNDLPTNDFNAIFQALPDFYCDLKKERNHAGAGAGGPSIYVAAYPGTFYGRIFPDNSLHFIYSSYSLHWLSKVPPGLYDAQGESINKGSICITERSPPEVSKAYVDQFNVDFSLFLRLRSEELIVGGKMVLIFLGRETPLHIDRGNSFFWELLIQSFSTLISQGDVEEEKLDSYDVHFYAPSKEDVEEAVKREGSFVLERLEMFEIEKEVGGDINGGKMSYGRRVAMAVRAIQESMMTHHFGGEIVERLFEEYGRLVDQEMAKQEIRPITFGVVLRKL